MRHRIRRYTNHFIILAVAGSWIAMTLFGKGTLAENGLGNLKYFTVLSNLFEGISSAVWLVRSREDGEAGEGAERLKYIAASSVALTFTTVMVFLGPLYGYASMFEGANLFFHLITPLAAMAEIIFLSDADFTLRDNNLALIPPTAYGVVYVGNCLINGVGEWPDTNDWYLFLAWGYPVGILVFASICLATWLLGLMMRKLQQARRAHSQ